MAASISAIVRKFTSIKRAILATGLVGVAALSIIGYYSLESIGRASIEGVYLRMFGWARCYSETPSPHVNITTNDVLISSTNPSPFKTNLRSVSFVLTVDSLNIGTFQPGDTYFTSDHESLPWLRFTVFNGSMAKTIVEKNSNVISLVVNAIADTIFYHKVVELSDSFNYTWKPSVLSTDPGCLEGYRS